MRRVYSLPDRPGMWWKKGRKLPFLVCEHNGHLMEKVCDTVKSSLEIGVYRPCEEPEWPTVHPRPRQVFAKRHDKDPEWYTDLLDNGGWTGEDGRVYKNYYLEPCDHPDQPLEVSKKMLEERL